MIRRLLFILFLYVLLVWLVVFYLHSGDTKRLVDQGLLWTAGGVAALLLWLILERVVGWWRSRRAQVPSRPVAQGASAKPLHDDDAALLNLLSEADQRLAQAPGPRPSRALDLPLYLIVGPEGAGKTAVLHSCGIEPSLLAGQVVGGSASVNSTRVANLWLAQQALFLEVGGRIFGSEASRFAEFVSRLQSGAAVVGWKSWFQPPNKPVPLRAVLLFYDVREFTGTPELSKLDRAAQQIRERLSAIASALGAEFPVYVLFTKLDSLPYFTEFFARLAEGESGQVLGVLAPEQSGTKSEDRVWAEAETRRLNSQFNSLFLRLSERRLLALTQELEPGRKPAVYEFPREFKRIRTPLIQFLVDVFKPDPLKAGPRLRGFFFTGTRKAERWAPAETGAHSAFPPLTGAAAGTTQLFRADVTSLFSKAPPKSGSGPSVDRWMFVTDFFHKVLSQDRPVVKHSASPSKLDGYRRIAVGVAAGLAIFLGLAWTISWAGNWQLETHVKTAVDNARRGDGTLSLLNLQALDELRQRLEEIGKDNALSLHWGLYTGDRLRTAAQKVYFDRLKGLSLDRINQTLVSRLSQAGTGSQPESTRPIYDRLKTHRTITALGCSVDRPLISKILKETAADAHPGLSDEHLALLRLQLDFYASQLGVKGELPTNLPEDPAAEAKARLYLRQAGGLEQQLRALLNDLGQQIKPLAVADYADDYRSVLTGPTEFAGVFTKKGIAGFEDMVEKGNFGSGGEMCVMGDSGSLAQQSATLQVKDRLRSLYYRQYADTWREFLGSFSVIRYSGPDDAARRLNILAGPRSPLLGIVKLAAVNTNFPPAKPGELSWWEKGAQKVGLGGVVQAQQKGEKAADRLRQFVADDTIMMTPADVARLFQPVAFTTPPDVDRLVGDNDGAYVQALRGLQQGLEALARASPAEKATATPQARTALAQARAAHAGLADKFTDVGNEGLSRQLIDLLDQPIRLVDPRWVISVDPGMISSAKKNVELAQFCKAMSPILTKYPFSSAGPADATLNDVENGFKPLGGLVWKYVQQSGSDLVVRMGQQWQPNPALQGMKVVPELIGFLNRSQQLTGALFTESGNMQPRVKYVLRPVPGQSITIRLTLDGDEFNSRNALQKTFYWPAAAGAKAGADGTVEAGGGFSTGFGHFDGIWGVFKLFQNADERPNGKGVVQWSEIRGRGNPVAQKISPAAKVELVELPGDVDLFNPRFFEALQCPTRAVVVN
jgi:type VI secretion system protein ImpL